jgi:hypothetical protein
LYEKLHDNWPADLCYTFSWYSRGHRERLPFGPLMSSEVV